MALQPVNLFGINLHADSYALACENRLNCFYDIRKSDTGDTIAVIGTPGSYTLVPDPTKVAVGMHVVNNVLYWVSQDGTGLWSIDIDGNVTFCAGGPIGSPYVQMADCYTQIFIISGTGNWVYDIGAGTMTLVTDPNCPANCTSVCFISGRFVVNKRNTREFYCSAALDGLTWTYLGSLPMFGTKEQASDPLFMVSSQNGVLALMGNATIEFWQDAGLTPVPFQLIQGTTQAYGTKSLYSVCKVNDSTIFLGQGPQGGMGVYAIKGYTISKISTSDIDDILADWKSAGATFRYTHAVTYNAHGHDFYQLTDINADNYSLLYDVTTGIWSRTSFYGVGTPATEHGAQFSALFNGQTAFTAYDNVFAIGVLDVNTYGDANQPIKRQVTTKRLRQGGNEFAISELVLIMDTGEVPIGQDYHITLEVSRDGGRTFGSPRPRTLGMLGQYREPRVKWDRLGSAREFVLRFTMTDPIPFVIAGAEWEVA